MNAPAQLDLLDDYGLPAKNGDTTSVSTPAPTRRPAPLAANDDPDTSHAAAERAQVSERQKSLSRRVFACVASRATPPTFHEIAREIGEEDHAVMKRLNQLRHERRVEHTPKRICSVTGTLCVGWRATEPGSTTVPTAPNDARQPAPIQRPSPAPAECTRCKGAGRTLIPGSDPLSYGFCDELMRVVCRHAERRHRLRGDANAELSPSELEALAR